jgi:hypothetical protein
VQLCLTLAQLLLDTCCLFPAGTILGAVGGPVGAAAGAALGGGAARRIADAFGGDKGQAEVYDQVR